MLMFNVFTVYTLEFEIQKLFECKVNQTVHCLHDLKKKKNNMQSSRNNSDVPALFLKC